MTTRADPRDPFPPLPRVPGLAASDITDLGTVTLRGDIRSYAWDGGSDLSGGVDATATAGFLLDSSSGRAQFQEVFAEGGTFTGVTIEGDLVSSNWDGADPLDLSSRDATATQGFGLDASAGAAQFEGNVWIGGSLTVDGTTTLDATLTMSAGAIIRSAASGARVQIDTSSSIGRVQIFSDSANETAAALIRGVSATDPVLHISGPSSSSWTGQAQMRMDTDVQITAPRHIFITSGSGSDVQIGQSGASQVVIADNQIRTLDGTAAAPGYGFIGSGSDDGFFHTTDVVGVAIAGTERFRVNTAALLHNATGGPYLPAAAGTVSAPAFAFTGDTDTGMYRVSANSLGFAAGGSLSFTATSTTGLRVVDGSASTPSYSWTADIDTGMFLSGAGVIGIATAGTNRIVISATEYANGPVRDQTTASAANVFIDATSGKMQRSTSTLANKSRVTYNVGYLADIPLKPIKFYSKPDHRWFYGLAADDLATEDELLGHFNDDGEIQDYDQREVMAVFAAKINRLEAEVATLKEAA